MVDTIKPLTDKDFLEFTATRKRNVLLYKIDDYLKGNGLITTEEDITSLIKEVRDYLTTYARYTNENL
jgi:hypothetical protein